MYNGSRFIGEALRSALDQTYRDFEIVVWDDGSTDGSADLVKELDDGRIRLFRSERNQGPAITTNAAIRAAKGEFIKFLHQDDLLESRCLEAFLDVMERSESVGFAFAPRQVQDERPPAQRTGHPEPHRGLGQLAAVNDGAHLFRQIKETDFELNFIGEPSNVMVRRERFTHSGLCNTRVRQVLDLDLWVRLIYDCAVGFVDEKLSVYRFHHQASLTARHLDQGMQWLDRLWLLEGLSAVPKLWKLYPDLAERRRATRGRLPRDFLWLMQNRRLHRQHVADVVAYVAYLARARGGRAPRILGRL